MTKPTLSQMAVFALLSSALAIAQPASLGPVDVITKPGNAFDEISGYYPGPPHSGDPDDEEAAGCTWYPSGTTAIFTAWDHGGSANHLGHCLWVQYTAELTPGSWLVGLNAINHGTIMGPRWYPAFEVLVEVEGLSSRPQRAIVRVPASDEEVRSGQQSFLITKAGTYGIKYTWLNDRFECTDPDWKPGEECDPDYDWYDVNIVIDSVFFSHVRRRAP